LTMTIWKIRRFHGHGQTSADPLPQFLAMVDNLTNESIFLFIDKVSEKAIFTLHLTESINYEYSRLGWQFNTDSRAQFMNILIYIIII
jgi:hypothetical protein